MQLSPEYKGLTMNFSNIYESLNSELSKINTKKNMFESASMDSFAGNESFGLGGLGMNREQTLAKSNWSQNLPAPKINYNFENKIRELFNKPKKDHEIREIGCHPDFKNLECNDSKLTFGYSVTLFMDIIGSTKLGVIYSPEEVFFIKNSVIKCAIETINAFDGHVHRIMGDAVMAFFRSNSAKNHMDSAIDAINCATYLIKMIQEYVQPNLVNTLGNDENIGIRIGIDYGDDKDVVWGHYGDGLINEVTATSFYVDVAAKLQQKAPKNSLMIGQSIKDLLGLDREHYLIKTSNGSKDYYLTPNYIGRDGVKINYKQFIFNTDDYFSRLPGSSNNRRLKIDVKIRNEKHSTDGLKYVKCASSVPKNKHLFFHVSYLPEHQPISDKMEFKFDVYNTGEDAKNANKDTLDNHTTTIVAAYENHQGIYTGNHFEHTAYKGLHKVIVSVLHNGTSIEHDVFSIFIH